mmetsp:Transcript_4181/g.5824  ORF Transcript_4181/g.5824 Transcript_4181/m.5824 type:complete len:209 (+) Transcript_4181:681-1307(+)
MGLNLDDFSSGNFVSCSVANSLLVLLDGRTINNSSSSYTNMVVFGENPSVEVWGNIVSNIHLSHFFVKGHLFLGDLDALLEGNCEVVLSSVHSLSNTGVSAISSDNDVYVHGGGNTSGRSFSELLEINCVLRIVVGLVVGGYVYGGNESIDNLRSVFYGTVTNVLVQDLATAHTNVLIGLKSVSDIHFNSSWGDKIHLTDLSVNNSLG